MNKFYKIFIFLSLIMGASSAHALEGMVEPQQLIKVAIRVNYDLGLRIHRTKEDLLEVEHNKVGLPSDFQYLNYAFVCDEFEI